MLKELFEFVRSALLLSHDVQENRREVRELRQEISHLSEKLHQLALLHQQERSEREKLALHLENALLRAERRLPPPKPPEDRD